MSEIVDFEFCNFGTRLSVLSDRTHSVVVPHIFRYPYPFSICSALFYSYSVSVPSFSKWSWSLFSRKRFPKTMFIRMGDSRKYPYPTTGDMSILTPPLPPEIPKCSSPHALRIPKSLIPPPFRTSSTVVAWMVHVYCMHDWACSSTSTCQEPVLRTKFYRRSSRLAVGY